MRVFCHVIVFDGANSPLSEVPSASALPVIPLRVSLPLSGVKSKEITAPTVTPAITAMAIYVL